MRSPTTRRRGAALSRSLLALTTAAALGGTGLACSSDEPQTATESTSGSDTSTTEIIEVTPETTEAETTTSTEPEPESPYSEDEVDIVTNEGWSYVGSGTVDGVPRLSAEKDISSSPPGKARLVLTLEAPATDFEAVGNTPGRSAPEIVWSAKWMVWGFSRSGINEPFYEGFDQQTGWELDGDDGAGNVPCEITRLDQYIGLSYESPDVPQGEGIICNFDTGGVLGGDDGGGTYTGSIESSEEAVDAIVDEVNRMGAPVIGVFVSGTGILAPGDCKTLFLPDGSILPGPLLTTGKC